LLGYIRSFTNHPREIWNRGERCDQIVKIIVEHALEIHKFREGIDSLNEKKYLTDEFEVLTNYKV
jgi:hypothetical protein